MDRGRRHAQVEQVVIDEVGCLLGANKDERTRRRHGDQQVIQRLHLLVLVGPQELPLVSKDICWGRTMWTYMLLDIDMDGSSTANADVNMIGSKEFAGQLLQMLGEGRREEKIAMITISIGIWKT